MKDSEPFLFWEHLSGSRRTQFVAGFFILALRFVEFYLTRTEKLLWKLRDAARYT